MKVTNLYGGHCSHRVQATTFAELHLLKKPCWSRGVQLEIGDGQDGIGGGEQMIYKHPLRVLQHKNIRTIYFQDRGTSAYIECVYQVENIINKHLAGDRDILMCQDELIEAGLVKWARI